MIAEATRSLRTKSSLSFGLDPHAVANLNEIILNLLVEIFLTLFQPKLLILHILS